MMGTVPMSVGEKVATGMEGGLGRRLTSTDKHGEETVSNGVTDCINLSVQNIRTI